ncbi:hypothetical protein PR048_021533 [Dryococelus australis]|uniref:Uncharacterized protein n=1 Tax=Dryococelus australis TaxID=614101 RepID=A0ABQ9GYG0_9NEOP|nr:hypothetical protein PR048_021533 [Dryococelus australis]
MEEIGSFLVNNDECQHLLSELMTTVTGTIPDEQKWFQQCASLTQQRKYYQIHGTKTETMMNERNCKLQQPSYERIYSHGFMIPPATHKVTTSLRIPTAVFLKLCMPFWTM